MNVIQTCLYVPPLSWRKNENNLAILHAIVMGLALIHCTHEGDCHAQNSESPKRGKVLKQKTPYTLNRISLAVSTF